VLRLFLTEELPADHPVDEEDERGQDRHAPERREAAPDCRDQDADIGEQMDDPDDPGEPGKPEDGRVLPHDRREREPDGEEVEDVPAVVEEPPWSRQVGGDPQQDLDHQEREEDVVQEVESAAVAAVELWIRLQAEDERVRKDDRHDRGRERGRIDQSPEHRHRRLNLAADYSLSAAAAIPSRG
jgi:hypothetical protein